MPQFPYLVSDLLYDIVEGLNYCFVHTILKEIVQHNLLLFGGVNIFGRKPKSSPPRLKFKHGDIKTANESNNNWQLYLQNFY